jgi:hypothetical protein
MKFTDLLQAAIQRSEIPLRFEPGAEEAVAKPLIEVLQAWLEAHRPTGTASEYASGQAALIAQLVDEIRGVKNLPGE